MLQCTETEAAMGAFKEMWARGEDPDDWMVKGSVFERFEAEAGIEYFKERAVDDWMVNGGEKDLSEAEYSAINLKSFLHWLLDKHPEADEVFNFLQESLLDDGYNVVSFSDMVAVLPPGYWDRLRGLLIEFSKMGSAPVEASIRHKAILLRINKLYRSNMSAQELYETTRGVWRVSIERAMEAELALAVYQGIVKEVYRINSWYPAGTLKYQYRDDPRKPIYKDRWEFDGEIAEDLRGEYVGKSVEPGRYPVCYINV